MADVIESTLRYYATCSAPLPIRTITTALRAICKYFDGVSGCDLIPHSEHYIFIYLSFFLLQRFSYYVLKKESAKQGEE
jgi:hypothetical protein